MGPSAFAFVLAAALGSPQDDPLRELADLLDREGVSGALAALLKDEFGRQAVQERIELLLQSRTGPIERDPQGHFEAWMFERDASGALRVRPGRRGDLESLARRAARAPQEREDWDTRCDAFAARIADADEFGKRMKQAWTDPAFRLAMFHRHSAEVRLPPAGAQAESLLGLDLAKGADGRLRIPEADRPAVLERRQGEAARFDALRAYEKAYLKQVVKVKEEAPRILLASDAGRLFVLGRLLRQAAEGSERQIGGILENEDEELRNVSFNLDLEELVPDLRAAEALSAGLKSHFDRLLPDLASGVEENDLADFLRDGRMRLLLAERILDLRFTQKLRADAVFEAIAADAFDDDGGKLRVKKDRYKDDSGAPSLEALADELRGPVDELRAAHAPFDLIAERCVEKEAGALFEDLKSTGVLREHLDAVVARLVESAREGGLGLFAAAWLVEEGGVLKVRPERAARVRGLAERAAQLKREAGQD
jgi:hypothetical protein